MILRHLTLTLIVTIFATNFSMATQDKKAEEILTKTSKLRAKGKATEGDFYYILENKTEKLQEKSFGHFLIKDDKYWVDILGVETFFNGKTIFSFIKDANELTIQDAEEDETISPTNLFDIYQKGFDAKYIGEENLKMTKLYLIDLYPKDNTKDYTKIRVKITKKDNKPYSIETFGKTGDNVRIEVVKMKTNLDNISDSRFSFDTKTKPDIEVIDMR